MRSWLACVAFTALASSLLLSGCGGKKDSVTPQAAQKPPDLDSDPMSLLPGNAIAVTTLDTRAFFASPSFGPQLAQLAEKYVPIGQEANFVAARDLARVTCGSYAMQGADVACVLTGQFDQARIDQMAQNHAPTKSGGVLVASQYAGKNLYTVNNIGFVVLTPHTVIAGTETGMRRALDRVSQGRFARDIAPWMVTTLETQGAVGVLVVDASSQQVPQNLGIPGAATQGLRAVRAFVNFNAPGFNLAGSLTYADPATAQSASAAIQQQARFLAFLPVIGVQLKQFNVAVQQSDVQITISTDDQSLKNLLTNAPRLAQ